MKRIFVVILSLVYFVASSGVLLRQHYCMGDLVDTQVDCGQIMATDTCGDCGMEEGEDSCCESKLKLVKKVEDQKYTEIQILNFSDLVTDLIPTFFVHNISRTNFHESELLFALQKPPPKSIPVFLECRNLRI